MNKNPWRGLERTSKRFPARMFSMSPGDILNVPTHMLDMSDITSGKYDTAHKLPTVCGQLVNFTFGIVAHGTADRERVTCLDCLRELDM